MQARPQTWVYFIEALELDAVKIGLSTDIEYRLCALGTGSPAALEFLFALPGDRDVERHWHAVFAHAFLRGEWFRLSAIEQELRALDALPSTLHIPPKSRWYKSTVARKGSACGRRGDVFTLRLSKAQREIAEQLCQQSTDGPKALGPWLIWAALREANP